MHIRIEKLINFSELRWSTFTMTPNAISLLYRCVIDNPNATVNFKKEDALNSIDLTQELVSAMDVLSVQPKNKTELAILNIIVSSRLKNIKVSLIQEETLAA